MVLDVGPAVRASTETTFYSQAKTCLINILQRKVSFYIKNEKNSKLLPLILQNPNYQSPKIHSKASCIDRKDEQ